LNSNGGRNEENRASISLEGYQCSKDAPRDRPGRRNLKQKRGIKRKNESRRKEVGGQADRVASREGSHGGVTHLGKKPTGEDRNRVPGGVQVWHSRRKKSVSAMYHLKELRPADVLRRENRRTMWNKEKKLRRGGKASIGLEHSMWSQIEEITGIKNGGSPKSGRLIISQRVDRGKEKTGMRKPKLLLKKISHPKEAKRGFNRRRYENAKRTAQGCLLDGLWSSLTKKNRGKANGRCGAHGN